MKKILILNGAGKKNGNTAALIKAFTEGAITAGNEVKEFYLQTMNIHGCMACDYCRNKEKGVCAQKDDMQIIYPHIQTAEMIVFASPIYCFTMSAQLQAALHRIYAPDIPEKVKKAALILSSGSRFVYGPAITEYFQAVVEYWRVQNMGIFTAYGEQNGSAAKREELYAFGRNL